MTSIPIYKDMPSLTMRDDDLHELEPSVRRSDSVRRSAGTLYMLTVRSYHNINCQTLEKTNAMRTLLLSLPSKIKYTGLQSGNSAQVNERD